MLVSRNTSGGTHAQVAAVGLGRDGVAERTPNVDSGVVEAATAACTAAGARGVAFPCAQGDFQSVAPKPVEAPLPHVADDIAEPPRVPAVGPHGSVCRIDERLAQSRRLRTVRVGTQDGAPLRHQARLTLTHDVRSDSETPGALGCGR